MVRPWWTGLLTAGRRRGTDDTAATNVSVGRLIVGELAWVLQIVTTADRERGNATIQQWARPPPAAADAPGGVSGTL